MRIGPRYALYLAVLPFYREACVTEVLTIGNDDVAFFAGDRHIDSTVRSGISSQLYTLVSNRVIASRVLLQFGSWNAARQAQTTVVDLNPRNGTAWMLLILRRILRRRTLVWGHLHPRQGAGSSTALVRRLMRRLSSGTILYGYDSVVPALQELPTNPVWVAPNSLYRRRDMEVPSEPSGRVNWVTYVGRLEVAKKVDVLIRGFVESGLDGTHELIVVGQGARQTELMALARELGVEKSVQFLGPVAEPSQLRAIYDRSICSVSPGYVGLSLTQSLGFGVPMIVSRDEPHAPEIELERFGAVTFFDTDDVGSLAEALVSAASSVTSIFERRELRAKVSESYSAESMAVGLMSALVDAPQNLLEDGWPSRTN